MNPSDGQLLIPLIVPVFETELALTAPLIEKHVLQGKASQSELDAYVKTTSTAPFFQGTAAQAMPTEWKGIWQGRVQLNELEAQSNGGRILSGSTVNIQLKLEFGAKWHKDI